MEYRLFEKTDAIREKFIEKFIISFNDYTISRSEWISKVTEIYNEKFKYQGYVYAFPDDRAKNYRLVADIEENNIKKINFF